MMGGRAKLSAAVLALILAGAPASVILDQFLQEKEGNTLVAVMDPGGVWSLCRGVTVIDGKRVVKGQKATEAQCKKVNAIERNKALAWVDRNIKVPLTEPQKAGIASFCPYNIGPGKVPCHPGVFSFKLEQQETAKGLALKSGAGYLTAVKIVVSGRITALGRYPAVTRKVRLHAGG